LLKRDKRVKQEQQDPLVSKARRESQALLDPLVPVYQDQRPYLELLAVQVPKENQASPDLLVSLAKLDHPDPLASTDKKVTPANLAPLAALALLDRRENQAFPVGPAHQEHLVQLQLVADQFPDPREPQEDLEVVDSPDRRESQVFPALAAPKVTPAPLVVLARLVALLLVVNPSLVPPESQVSQDVTDPKVHLVVADFLVRRENPVCLERLLVAV